MGTEKERCVIVTAFGDIEIAAKKINLSNKDFIIAADYGFYKAKEINVLPDLIVGDMDSVQEKNIPNDILFQKYSPIKDDTDTLIAIKEGIKRGFLDFIILGGLGGRLDHTLANLQCIKYVKNHGGNCYIIDNNSKCTVIKNETLTVFNDYKYFSLFCFSNKATGVTLKGFKYPLNDATVIDDFPIGVSNEIMSKEGQVTVINGELLIIETN